MIAGIGIDAVDIIRFAQWHTFKPSQLRRIFSDQEIEYCLTSPTLSAARFAARFAAREALFKAFQSLYPTEKLPFLTLCKAVSVLKHPNGTPFIEINWKIIRKKMGEMPELKAILTLTDTSSTAIALVTLSFQSESI